FSYFSNRGRCSSCNCFSCLDVDLFVSLSLVLSSAILLFNKSESIDWGRSSLLRVFESSLIRLSIFLRILLILSCSFALFFSTVPRHTNVYLCEVASIFVPSTYCT